MNPEFVRKIEGLAESSRRFRPEAYFWVLRVLEFTRRRLGRQGHVSGQELLEGMRELALEEFGPMAYDVLTHWGLRRTDDIGSIVFQLVDVGLLGKTEKDSVEDFAEVYEFKKVFIKDYPW